MRIVLIATVLGCVLLGALIWSQWRTEPFAVSGYIESHQIRVGSRVGGRVARVLVSEGQAVDSNALLVELDPYDLRERLAQIKAERAATQAALDLAIAGPRSETIESARAARDRFQAELDKALAGTRPEEIQIAEDKVARAEPELLMAQKDYARVENLHKLGQAASDEMDKVTRNLAVAQAEFARARDELALLRAGTRVEDIAAARARLAEAVQTLAQLEAGTRAEEITEAKARVASAEAAVAVVERQIAELAVRAPVDCVVEAIDLRPGDLVAASAPVIALADPSEMWVRAYLPENRLDVQLGQPVSVRVDSFPDRRFAGRVSYVSREAEFIPSNVQTPEERIKQVFRIKVTLEEGRDVLRAGMSADVFLEPPG